MEESIEIYIRKSGDHDFLNIYVPSRLRDAFINGAKNGLIKDIGVPMNFEMSVDLPRGTNRDESIHVSLDIKAINVIYTE